MSTSLFRGLLLSSLCLASTASLAQDASIAAAPAAAAPTAPPAPTVSVEKAYQREYALLEAQKRELTTRITNVRKQTEQDSARLESEVTALENQVFALRSEAESAADAWSMLTGIVTGWEWKTIVPFFHDRALIASLLVVGLATHLWPADSKEKVRALFSRMPLELKVVAFVVVIQVAMEAGSIGVQPFIYFQF